MTETTVTQAALAFAPFTIPVCALCGGFAGALSGGSITLLTEPGVLAFTTAAALIAGLPTGLLFWTMKDTSVAVRTTFALILLLVCCLAFLALFIPLNGIATV